MSGHVDGLFQVTSSLRGLLRMGLATTFSGGSGFTADEQGHHQSPDGGTGTNTALK